ncbi:MAG TPA: hypothetical protein VFY73_28220 [Ideonella sp.]|uniref:hypothetical protein n=1 Tax=Ideonella sp. TaxID=1929293 RepID=UPI002E31E8A2|nr:hypothetical protein [Ideonella sp.]HEX5687921.1 hypothetical protein [Ideonella sp.]
MSCQRELGRSIISSPPMARRRGVACWAAACVLAAAGGTVSAGEVAIDFDFSRAHDFIGFGTQVWLKGDRGGADAAGPKLGPKAREKLAATNAAADSDEAGTQLLKELNARFVRVSLIPKVTFDQLRPGMSVDQLLEVLQRNDNPAQRDRLAAFNRRMKELNIQPVLIFWRMPEPWAEKRMQKAGSKGQAHFAKNEHLQDYANFLTAQMVWLQRQGVQAVAVELTNEPHGAWDTKYEREQYAALVLKTRAAMDARGLQSWAIAGPGTGIRNFDHYIGGIVNANATKALGFISAHSYVTPQVLADHAAPGMASFLGRGKFGPIMVTEFGVKKHNDDDPEAASDLDVGSTAYAVQAAASATLLLGQGASALIYWQLQDFSFTKKQHGMLAENGQRRPAAFAMKALFGSVPPGAKVVGASKPNAQLPAAALQANGKTFVMMVNPTSQAQAVTARLQGSKACGAVAKIDAYNAGGADAKAAVRDASAQGGAQGCTLKAELQPGTVATVVLQ